MNFRGVATLVRGNKTKIATEDEIAHGMAYEAITGTATSYTLPAAWSGHVVLVQTTGGTITVTLPALQRGLNYTIINQVNQSLVIACSPTDIIVSDGNDAADSVTYATSSHMIGATAFCFCDGTKWNVINMSVGCAATVAG